MFHKRLKVTKRFYALTLIFIILLGSFPVDTAENNSVISEEAALDKTKHVLYISSYSPALFTFGQQLGGIRKRFGANRKIKLDAEFMDSKNFHTEENLQNFYKSLKYKIENGKQYDAVIVGDDNGLVYLMENKNNLFPKTPLFFLGINNIETAVKSHEDPLVTGVVEAKSFNKTINLAKVLNPDAKRVVGLIDNTASSISEIQDIMKLKPHHPELEFATIDMSTMTFAEFFVELETIKTTDIVFYLSSITDKTGKKTTWDEMRRNIDAVLDVPIYGAVNYGIGDGMFGGCVISHVDQGYAAADMVMEYFLGTPINEIAFSTESPNAYIIDYQKFKEFGFSLDRLPQNTVLINRTYTFWEQHLQTVLIGIFVIIIESIIIFFLIKNILKRRTTESALRHNEKKFRSYIENAPDGILIVNEKGQIQDVNDATCSATGYGREELLHLSMCDLVQKEYIDHTTINFKRASEDGYVSDELCYVTKPGEQRFWSIEAVKLSPIRFLYFAKDITDRKEAEAEKEKLQEQLHQGQKMDAIGQLAGGVAHDFNNILAAIMGAAQILQKPKRNPTEEALRYLDMIMKSSKRAADLNHKLLAFSRKGKVTSTTINMDDIVDDTLAIIRQTLDKRIEITSDKDAKNTVIIGDDSVLHNTLLNLCINASHAMPDGGHLSIMTRNVILNENYCQNSPFELEVGEFIDIEVRDTGTGISPENIKKIFEPFFTTKDEGKGTGLGLAAVYGTIQDHKGAVTVYSEVGVGTSFHLLIPCSESKVVVSEIVENISQGTGLILLIDDEEFIRITCKFTLEEMGYNVIMAKNGLEAVEIFREKHKEIDLVIIDMIMPKMNGSEAFKIMKEIDDSCKVIISSGFTKAESLSELKNLGLLGFIQKPFRNNELLTLMADILGE